ncbi:N-alpha-acetyl diaminobutyric acid deacetylase DoeB [Metapseudomonas resinovorans]|uniref:succinylglutamate desuccinylase/aspartoacylase domain-containing protein n=1 Tax=Metapseudomonas resinovorans TaxID=53412 RepID=UPI000987CD41|nr:succinylglutamate desuccinylase/aspartoacylase family protein [Pseudomonas resinovorans]GLZ87910.1 N-alpha-acetyl diaminobutyric acid deacetylase DoeB [Pseudomonas resinovorans]
MNKKSKGRLAVDWKRKGRQYASLNFPWSRNESAWGSLQIPIIVIANGEGPFVLLVGGNHGDEYEGPLALSNLARELEVERVSGTICIVPALNYPALKAGTRLSPIDGLNMNRAFLGRAEGSITEQIAHFVEVELIGRADAVLDIHAGGRTMMFQPFAVSHQLPDVVQTSRAREALIAFGAPIGLILEELDNEGMLDTAVEREGKLFLSTELGGGGSTTAATIKLAYDGAHNFLVHTGVYRAAVKAPPVPVAIMKNESDGYVSASTSGFIEFTRELGEVIEAGELIARIHDFDNLHNEPLPVTAPVTGTLLGRHFGGYAYKGDFLAMFASPED